MIISEVINYMKKENFEQKKLEKYENLYREEIRKIRKICRDDLAKQLERIYYSNVELSHKLGLNSFLKSLQYNKYCIKILVPKIKYLSTIFMKQEESKIKYNY